MTRLALVMIVRNEERSLARCLESARSSVDRIIVMDTGSWDRTVMIARGFGAEVHQMEWPNDFAAARNAALEKSDADWNLILDADEWLSSGIESLGPRHLPALGDAPPSFVGRIRVADAGEDSPTRNFIPRVLPRGIRYEGRIHEQPITTLPRADLPVLVLHDGYDEAQLHRKKGRNENLLVTELAEKPNDVYLRYQLGRQYLLDGKNDAAAECLVASYNASTAGTPFRHGIIIYTILALRLSQSNSLMRSTTIGTYPQTSTSQWLSYISSGQS
jgi:glycosyltransferase involved in cell wall biosynthesis